MARLKNNYESEGFYGIGVLYSQDAYNVGTLWRSAYILGASFIFTIDHKYKKQSSDVTKSWSKIPLFHYSSFEDFKNHLPFSTKLIGVELTDQATELKDFAHPQRAVYLLGAENTGIPPEIINECHDLISLPGAFSLNVAVTGSIVAHDRHAKIGGRLPTTGNH
ncbi:RNA methyltransferase [Rubritalea tangerina]|uniref:RNA methyltransferase n=1 Tax=Rubritalea tangerina TaxID=430798 RepID=A0ABW4ZBV3_9BACT